MSESERLKNKVKKEKNRSRRKSRGMKDRLRARKIQFHWQI